MSARGLRETDEGLGASGQHSPPQPAPPPAAPRAASCSSRTARDLRRRPTSPSHAPLVCEKLVVRHTARGRRAGGVAARWLSTRVHLLGLRCLPQPPVTAARRHRLSRFAQPRYLARACPLPLCLPCIHDQYDVRRWAAVSPACAPFHPQEPAGATLASWQRYLPRNPMLPVLGANARPHVNNMPYSSTGASWSLSDALLAHHRRRTVICCANRIVLPSSSICRIKSLYGGRRGSDGRAEGRAGRGHGSGRGEGKTTV